MLSRLSEATPREADEGAGNSRSDSFQGREEECNLKQSLPLRQEVVKEKHNFCGGGVMEERTWEHS